MGDDIAELKLLVQQQTREAVEAQRRVDTLIAEMALMRAAAPAGPAHVPDAAAVAAALVAARADKISKLGVSLRKSYKIKEFKDTNEGSVKRLADQIRPRNCNSQEDEWYS